MNLNVYYFIAFVSSISCLVHATSTSIKKKRTSNLLKKEKGSTEVHDIVDEVVDQLGSYDVSEPDSSQEQPIIQVIKQVSKSQKKNQPVLADKTNIIKNVGEVEEMGKNELFVGQFILQVNKKFGELTDQENDDELVKFSENMDEVEFGLYVGPLTSTLECFKGHIRYTRTHDITVYFFVHGDMDIVKKVITGNLFCRNWKSDINDDYLIDAIFIALRNDYYGRAIDLFVIRAILTTEVDEQFEIGGLMDFESFMIHFFSSSPPGVVLLSLKRLLTIYGETLENRCPGILETICQRLVHNLKWVLNIPSRANLMADLVAQTSLLTPSAYIRGFFPATTEAHLEDLYDFVKYGWKEVIEMGLNDEWHGCKSERLWYAIGKKFPEHRTGSCPPPPSAIAAALKLFPTRKQLQEDWVEKNAPGFLNNINEVALEFIPKVVVNIIIEYVMPTWLDIEHPMPRDDDSRINDQMIYDTYADLADPDID